MQNTMLKSRRTSRTVARNKGTPSFSLGHFLTGGNDDFVVSEPDLAAMSSSLNDDSVETVDLDTIDDNIYAKLLQPASLPAIELGKVLLKAAGSGNIEEIRSLMCRGAPFTTDWLGACALHYAATNNHSETCEVLLRAGISKNSRTKVERTAMHLAAYEGHIGVLDCLFRYDADIDATDMLEMTPLHWAVQNGHAACAKHLLRHGANPRPMNKFGLSALDIARQLGRADLVNMLQQWLRKCEQSAMEMTEEDNSEDEDDKLSPDVILTEEDHIETTSNAIVVEDTVKDVRAGPGKLQDIGDTAKCMSSGHRRIQRNNSVHNIVTVENVEDDEDTIVTSSADDIPTKPATPKISYASEHLSDAYTESMRILQQHGIEMLPPDDEDHSILTSALQTGHSVVLTEAGKQALKAVRPLMPTLPKATTIALAPKLPSPLPSHLSTSAASEAPPLTLTKIAPKSTAPASMQHRPKIAPMAAVPSLTQLTPAATLNNKVAVLPLHLRNRNVITLTADEFMAMTNNGSLTVTDENVLKKILPMTTRAASMGVGGGKQTLGSQTAVATTIEQNCDVQTGGIRRKFLLAKKMVPANRQSPQKISRLQLDNQTTANTAGSPSLISEVEDLQRQLQEARQLTQFYKKKFLKKEAEAALFKEQLHHILGNFT